MCFEVANDVYVDREIDFGVDTKIGIYPYSNNSGFRKK